MTVVALLVLVATIGLVAGQWRAVSQHVRRIDIAVASPAIERDWPPASLILCVRGAEAGLADCLDRLAAVDYPDVEIHVVIDHATDPSLPVAEQWRAAHPDIACAVHVLADRSPHATLKCSAVDQALGLLSARIAVAVLVDADARVYPQWLKDMVRPTLDSVTGMATGNRWYDPTAAGLGSLIRFIYNANCVIPMHAGGMTWGGSLALRRAVFEHPEFRPCLRLSPTEDATVRHAVDACGQRLACLPAVMLLTHDGISLNSCLGFIRRQLLWTRLYHPGWPLIAGGAVVAYAVALVITGVAIHTAWTGQPVATAVLAGALVITTLGNLVAIEWLHAAVSRCIAARQGIAVPAIDWLTRLRLLAALPLALPAFTWAAVSAARAQSVTWSGVGYRIVGPGRIALTDYAPVVAAEAAAGRAMEFARQRSESLPRTFFVTRH
ncbi:MAG: hypothetical protein RLZZ21_2199 [Planctomycetota bacterium]|jgi:hypothetical protein